MIYPRDRQPAAGGAAAGRQEQRAVVDAFLAAARDGDFAALLGILDPDVVREVHGARTVTVRTGSAQVVRVAERGTRTGFRARRVAVNGKPGILAWTPAGQVIGLMQCTVEHGRMTRIVSLTDHTRLAAVDLPAAPP